MATAKANGTMPEFASLSAMVTALLDKTQEVRGLFPETVKLANPSSSATAERSFSSLHRLKTWQNTISFEQCCVASLLT